MVYTQGRSKKVHVGKKKFSSTDSAKAWAKKNKVRSFALLGKVG